MVADLGHDVREAGNGHEALEVISAGRPDCVLMDLLMPELGGLETLEELQHQGNQIPVIVVTADVQETVQESCKTLGAVAFLNKPPKSSALRDAIENALCSRQKAG